ncbi:MAG: hypothetical protein LUF00_00970 [Lachnospiraceae bacterium]|nr:hypothetical protein [Lachnospiraceae bacterium]
MRVRTFLLIVCVGAVSFLGAVPAVAAGAESESVEIASSLETEAENEESSSLMEAETENGEAETGTEETQTEAFSVATETEESSSLVFSVENSQVYEGMDKSYSKGYSPTVGNGTVLLILPLQANGAVKDGTITVTPDLGETENSPFQYKNYQKTVKLTEEETKSGKSKSVYLFKLKLKLAEEYEEGIYPIVLTVQARGTDGTQVEQTFTIYVTLDVEDSEENGTEEETSGEAGADGEEAGADDAVGEAEGGEGSAKTETAPQSQPIVLVEDCSVSQERVEAGDTFTVTVTLRNTSSRISVQNMAVTASLESTDLSLTDPGGVYYLGSLSAGKETTLTLNFQARRDAAEGSVEIHLDMSYDNPDAETLTSSGSVSVNIYQPLDVELLTPVFPESVNAGDTFEVELSVMNLGRSTLYNVRFSLDADGLIPSGSTYIGTLEAGSEGSTAMKIFAGTLNQRSDGTSRELEEGESLYGETGGTLILIYEDTDGTEYTQEYEIGTTIEALVVETAEAEEEAEEKSGMPWLGAAALVFVLAASLSGIILRRDRLRKK